jgi:hypothetical protein
MLLASASRTKSSRAGRPLQIGPDRNTVREELRSDQQVLASNLRATAPASRLHLYTATAIQTIKRRLETTQALVRFTSRQSSETAQYIDACGWRDLARHENVPRRCAAITRTAAGREGVRSCNLYDSARRLMRIKYSSRRDKPPKSHTTKNRLAFAWHTLSAALGQRLKRLAPRPKRRPPSTRT